MAKEQKQVIWEEIYLHEGMSGRERTKLAEAQCQQRKSKCFHQCEDRSFSPCLHSQALLQPFKFYKAHHFAQGIHYLENKKYSIDYYKFSAILVDFLIFRSLCNANKKKFLKIGRRNSVRQVLCVTVDI